MDKCLPRSTYYPTHSIYNDLTDYYLDIDILYLENNKIHLMYIVKRI